MVPVALTNYDLDKLQFYDCTFAHLQRNQQSLHFLVVSYFWGEKEYQPKIKFKKHSLYKR